MAFRSKTDRKLWLWRARDPIGRTTVVWVLGGRDDQTLRKPLKKISDLKGKIFVSDDRDGYHRTITENQLFTRKDVTFPVEQDNSNSCDFLARFRHRTKVVSKA